MGKMVSAVKADAKINIDVNVGHLHRLQQLLLMVTADKTEKELDLLKDVMEKKDKDRLEHWMELFFFLTYFINEIETKAEEQNQTTQIDIDTYAENIKKRMDKTFNLKTD
jgi:tRNA A37 N6-isopentenylltransferase MiaA